MDERRFDDLTRALAAAHSRRRVVRALAGGVLAAASGLAGAIAGATRLAAAGCLPIRARCRRDGACCSGYCEPGPDVGRCACPPDRLLCDRVACCAPDEVCQRGGTCLDPSVCPEGTAPCGGRCRGPCPNGGYRDERCRCFCQPGMAECGGVCIDVTADPSNCGECGRSCADGEICAEGACGLPCTDNLDCPDPPFVCEFGTCPFGACFVVAVDCFPGRTCCKTADDILCVVGDCPTV